MPRLTYKKKTNGSLNLVSKVYHTDSIFGQREVNELFLHVSPRHHKPNDNARN